MSSTTLTWKPTPRQAAFLAAPDEVFEVMYGGAAGGGKDIDLNILIPTPDGYKKFGDLHVGDIVFSEFGFPIKIVAESQIFTSNLCYKLTFDDGVELIAGEGHLWNTYTVLDREKLWRRSDEYREQRRSKRASSSTGKRPDLVIANSDRVQSVMCKPETTTRTTQEIYDTLKYRNRVNHSIPLATELIMGKKTLPIDPYVLGVWLGDGNSYGANYTGIDYGIEDQLILRGYKTTQYSTPYSRGISNLHSLLRKSNLLQNKHIPDIYFQADQIQRLDLLKGLMDTDGCCLEDGQCEFCNVNEGLARGVYRLAASLGLKPTISSKINAVGNLTFYIKWTGTLNVFNLQRKSERLPVKVRSTQNQRYIVNCEPVESIPTKCIQVDNPTGLFLITEACIPTHNSEALLNLPIVREFFKYPRFKGIIFRRTYPELEAELIVRSESQGLYKGTGATYNKEKKRWQWPSGAIMQFGHLEYDSDVRKYDSAEYNLVEFDELTSFTEYQYLYLFSRCRSSDSNLPSLVRSGTNPGNVGHAWVRSRFVEPCNAGNVILTDKKTTLKRMFIPSKVQDNPYLMKNDPQYINRLQGMAEKDRRAKLDGDWYTFSGQVFDDYREEVYPGEPENACHVVDEFSIPVWWPRVLSIDWGYEALTYALWSAIAPNGQVFLYREYAIKHAKISQWATDIGRMSHNEQFADIVICQSAGQQRGDDLTIAQQFEKYSGLRPRLSVNEHGSRVASKLLLQEYLRWRARPTRKIPAEDYSNEIAALILRSQGMDSYKSYLTSFEPEEPEVNLPRIQIFRGLEVLRKTIPLCVYDDDHKEDVAEFDGDDPYDCLRYNIRAVDLISLNRAKNQHSHYEKIDSAVKEFTTTQDWTSYHRKMEKIESTKVRSARPIRMKRRAA